MSRNVWETISASAQSSPGGSSSRVMSCSSASISKTCKTNGKSGEPSTTGNCPIWCRCRKRLRATSTDGYAPNLTGRRSNEYPSGRRRMSKPTSSICRGYSIGTNGRKRTSRKPRTTSHGLSRKIRVMRYRMRVSQIPIACWATPGTFPHPRPGQKPRPQRCRPLKLMTRSRKHTPLWAW